MAPKKKTLRAHAQPQPALQSDYDTDTANVTDVAPQQATMANPLPARTNTELNLSVLRRYYPGVANILSIAPFAVVYQYSPETQAWEKMGFEGTGFVCELVQPAADDGLGGELLSQYAFIVLNRKSLDNFHIALETAIAQDIEITEEYVIVPVLGGQHGAEVAVYGLWMFSDEGDSAASTATRDIVAARIVECAMRAAPNAAMAGISDDGGYDGVEGAGYNVEAQASEEDGVRQFGSSISPQPAQPGEQSIDLNSLFAKPQAQTAATHIPGGYAQSHTNAPQQPQPHPTAWHNTADTDFFRTSSAQLPHQQQAQFAQHAGPQQNALLNLFKAPS